MFQVYSGSDLSSGSRSVTAHVYDDEGGVGESVLGNFQSVIVIR
jgi:hypothetical protein